MRMYYRQGRVSTKIPKEGEGNFALIYPSGRVYDLGITPEFIISERSPLALIAVDTATAIHLATQKPIDNEDIIRDYLITDGYHKILFASQGDVREFAHEKELPSALRALERIVNSIDST